VTGHPLRVAIVSREYPPFYGGGIGTYARCIVPALVDAGVRVHVITQAYDRTQPRCEFGRGVTVHRVPAPVRMGGWTNTAIRFAEGAARKVDELWARGEIDIVEYPECEAAGSVAMLGICGTPAAPERGSRPPTIVQLHTPSEQLFALGSLSSRVFDASLSVYFDLERLAIEKADCVLAPSAFIANWAADRYDLPRVPDVIPYAAEPPEAPLPQPVQSDPPCVLYAGRLEPRKGVEPLCIAWNRVAAAHPNAQLVMAGADTSGAPDGGSMRAYLSEVLTPEAGRRVRFLGRISATVLREQAARSDLCVIPSLWENFPNTCIEAMSNGRAVLASDNGGMREMFEGTNAGQTFRAGDPDDLAARMIGMLAEGREQLHRRGTEGFEWITKICNPATIAALRIEHFRRVIGEASCRKDAGSGLGFWKRMERTLSGTRGEDLPALPAEIARWVGAERGVMV